MRSFVAALVLAVLSVSAAHAAPKFDWTKVPRTNAEVGQTVEGSIDADDKWDDVPNFGFWHAWVAFSADAGEILTFTIDGGGPEPRMWLYEAHGAERPTGLYGPNTITGWKREFNYRAPRTGDYILDITNLKGPGGAYKLKIVSDKRAASGVLVAAAPPVGGTATMTRAPIETLSGEINAASPVLTGTTRYGCHKIDTEAGDTITVVMLPKGYAAMLFIVGQEGCGDISALAKTDYSPTPNLTFKSAGGSYWIMPTGLGGEGPYTLQIRRGVNAPTAQTLVKPLPVPKGTASTLAATGTGKAGQVIQDCPNCPKMVVVPAGSFMMGSAGTEEGRGGDEGPRHAVTLARPFAVGAYEVTFDEWDACVADKQCEAITKDEGWGRGKRPVINVAKAQVDRYLAWLSDKTGHKYFLPSESEWEYAARAGTDTPWSTGDALINDDANILNVFKRSVPVGSFPPNAFGLFDVHGNVAEWVQDCADVGYFGVPNDGGAALAPVATCAGIIRGGHWNSEPFKARSASRGRLAPGPQPGGNATGFRVTRALD